MITTIGDKQVRCVGAELRIWSDGMLSRSWLIGECHVALCSNSEVNRVELKVAAII